MSVINEVTQRKDRPAYVTFERVPLEDIPASRKAGRFVAKDVDRVRITPPDSKDVFIIEVDQWFLNMQQDVANGRMPQEWMDRYQEQYRKWLNGQTMPLQGTPIKGWGVISPAQQETLIRLNLLTVEDLAAAGDVTLQSIGMGGVALKQKAIGWLAQLQEKGPLTQEIAAVKQENDTLKGSVESLTRLVQELKQQIQMRDVLPVTGSTAMPNEIQLDEIVEPGPPTTAPTPVVKKPRGNPNWIKKDKA